MRRGERMDQSSGRVAGIEGSWWHYWAAPGPLRLARAGPGFAARRSQCQATAMQGAESVCKGEIVTMDHGRYAVEVELERGEGH